MSISSVVETLESELIALSGIEYVGIHPKRKTSMSLPAILIDLGEIEPGDDAGTGETPLRCHWELRLVTSDRDTPLTTWLLVQSLLQWVFTFEWTAVNVGKARFKQASPDHFSPEFHGHRVWLIEYVQNIRVGDNEWEGDAPFIEQFILHYPNCIPQPPAEVIDLPQAGRLRP